MLQQKDVSKCMSKYNKYMNNRPAEFMKNNKLLKCKIKTF